MVVEMAANIYDQVRNNKLKSWMIFLIFIVLVVGMGWVFGFYYGSPSFGLGVAALFGLVYALISYYAGGNMILSMTGAKEVKKSEYPHLFHTVEGLAIAAGIPKPKCYVINDTALNAFATGRDPKHAAITVTTGLMDKLNRQELEGVIAHEMSHIKNYDIRMMMLAAVMVGVVTLLSDFFLHSLWFGNKKNNDNGNLGLILLVAGIILAILAPFVAQLIKLAVSRKREYLADANGALLTRYPPGLASALEKISKDPDPLVDKANKATAHLFISTPFRKKKGIMTGMFSTHPPIQDRIKRLKGM